jgi:NAD kinase
MIISFPVTRGSMMVQAIGIKDTTFTTIERFYRRLLNFHIRRIVPVAINQGNSQQSVVNEVQLRRQTPLTMGQRHNCMLDYNRI